MKFNIIGNIEKTYVGVVDVIVVKNYDELDYRMIIVYKTQLLTVNLKSGILGMAMDSIDEITKYYNSNGFEIIGVSKNPTLHIDDMVKFVASDSQWDY